MALPETVSWDEFVVMLGDGATPENFTAPCGMTSRGFNRTASTGETEVPDCDDETLPSVTFRTLNALSAEISGSGVLALGSLPLWENFYNAGVAVNAKVILDKTLAEGGGYWILPMLLTTFNITGKKGEQALLDITLTSAGAIPPMTPAAA